MTRRYYCPSLPQFGGNVVLQGHEAQHAIRVMRVKPDDAITLFDGQGRETEAVITAVSRRECDCQSEPLVAINREPSVKMQLAIAFPKPDRCRELVERLTEIGVHSITPIVSNRTQRPPSPTLIDKMERVVIEACKQSGRNRLMRINPTLTALEFFSSTNEEYHLRLMAHPTSNANHEQLLGRESVIAAVGPEGGWTDEEVAVALAQGYSPITLGARILRIETAAVVIAARWLN
ncbi:RsmE family RNA methyltransferase [Novipirellula artificiosorum]|uniref:Ribosomal RNA small subunit methyltransferase E n=1 Tax=Novipirellula artificiosorum TaxID=2528016 RepID=A0A5C6DY55_9BACT|nr:RsmE family RNA methyltransferase [Novipirellula artificiosorum]TWU40777.1 Ribosomal RNA small subunit methyltransferase E [Novipirellula artificiosorum]